MCISLHICCLIFLYFYRSGWYFLQLIVSGFFSFFFLRKAITGSIEKVFYKVLFVFKMGQWFWIICFILGGVQLHVIVSGNTWAFCLAFGVRNSFLPKSLIFLIDFNWRWTITSFCKLLLQYSQLHSKFTVYWTDSFITQYLTGWSTFFEWCCVVRFWMKIRMFPCFLLKPTCSQPLLFIVVNINVTKFYSNMSS